MEKCRNCGDTAAYHGDKANTCRDWWPLKPEYMEANAHGEVLRDGKRVIAHRECQKLADRIEELEVKIRALNGEGE